ncbi:MAG: hypothetical protein COB20_06160 [SAR86 cluster bacterium]|uniref:Uncharacterized protein n=1 Tax=SAR86 cluster bacterium TaxID=2030880 RepID=A0A2A4X899_9GAMM|nr:MAG: hypothetical protein COB20_06160 [SAR86 cluster bacterium]
MTNRRRRFAAFNRSINNNSINNSASNRTTIENWERVRAHGTPATKVALAIPAQINNKAQRIHDSPTFLFFLFLYEL